MRALIAAAVLCASVSVSQGHDIFNGLYSDKHGRSCCGGDPQTGDCEQISFEDVYVRPDGSATVYSHRYGRSVELSRNIIEWKALPGQSANTQAAWCGKPRAETKPDEIQADPWFDTYCAFITPGGF